MRKSVCRWFLTAICMMVLLAAATVTVLAADGVDVEYYGRQQLSQMEDGDMLVYAYDQIVQAVDNTEATVSVTDGVRYLSKAQIKLVVRAVIHDHTEQFWLNMEDGYTYWLNSKGVTKVEFSYYFTGDALKNAKAQFDRKVATVLSVISLKKLSGSDQLIMVVENTSKYGQDATISQLSYPRSSVT